MLLGAGAPLLDPDGEVPEGNDAELDPDALVEELTGALAVGAGAARQRQD